MNAFQVAPDYIRDERDFLTPLSMVERLRRILKPWAIVPQAYPTNWMPCIDISGIGQTKAIASAFPLMVAAGWKLVIMRASIGLVKDGLFDYFWQAAYDAGMYLMAYHFAYPTYTAASQASIFLKTIDPMLTKLDGHSAAILDVEAPGDITAWRNTVTGFHSIVKTKLVTGDYSSISKWRSCTNNMPVSGFAFNASWSNLVNVPSFAPAIQTVLRQVGVYLKHAFVPPPPGVEEDVDVGYFMGEEKDLRKFLGYDETPPPPPPPSDLEKRLSELETGFDVLATSNHAEHLKMEEDIVNNTNLITDLKSHIDVLEKNPHPVVATFRMNERKPASWIRGQNGVGKPMFSIFPTDGSATGDRIFLEGDIQILPTLVLGDSGFKMYPVYKTAPVQLYVHSDDGVLIK